MGEISQFIHGFSGIIVRRLCNRKLDARNLKDNEQVMSSRVSYERLDRQDNDEGDCIEVLGSRLRLVSRFSIFNLDSINIQRGNSLDSTCIDELSMRVNAGTGEERKGEASRGRNKF